MPDIGKAYVKEVRGFIQVSTARHPPGRKLTTGDIYSSTTIIILCASCLLLCRLASGLLPMSTSRLANKMIKIGGYLSDHKLGCGNSTKLRV